MDAERRRVKVQTDLRSCRPAAGGASRDASVEERKCFRITGITGMNHEAM